MTLHYLNKVPRAARSGKTKRKIQNRKEARLLALFAEQPAAGRGSDSGSPWRPVLKTRVAAFRGCWQGIQWKLVRSWLTRVTSQGAKVVHLFPGTGWDFCCSGTSPCTKPAAHAFITCLASWNWGSSDGQAAGAAGEGCPCSPGAPPPAACTQAQCDRNGESRVF